MAHHITLLRCIRPSLQAVVFLRMAHYTAVRPKWVRTEAAFFFEKSSRRCDRLESLAPRSTIGFLSSNGPFAGCIVTLHLQSIIGEDKVFLGLLKG